MSTDFFYPLRNDADGYVYFQLWDEDDPYRTTPAIGVVQGNLEYHWMAQGSSSFTDITADNGGADAATEECGNGWYRYQIDATRVDDGDGIAVLVIKRSSAIEGELEMIPLPQSVKCLVGGVDANGRTRVAVRSVEANAITAAAVADGTIDLATFAQDALDLFRVKRRNSAQAGAAGTITLDAGASAVDNFYAGDLIYLYGDTGVGGLRRIMSYVGATKVATIAPAWATNPASGSDYIIFADSGYLQTGSITSNTFASSAILGATLAASAITAIQSGLALSSDMSTVLSRLSSARAGYLDNLNVGGNVAASSEVTSIQNNTRVVRVVPTIIERPASGTVGIVIEILLYDSVGNMEVPDLAPILDVLNPAGSSYQATRLSDPDGDMTSVATGHYRITYTVSASDAIEQLRFQFTVVEGGNPRTYTNTAQVVDATAIDFTSADRTKLERLHTDLTTLRAAKLDNLDAAITTRATNSHTTSTVAAMQTAVLAATDAILAAIGEIEGGDITVDLDEMREAVLTAVLDANAPVGAKTLGDIMNIFASYIAGEADGYPTGLSQQLTYKKLDGSGEPRLVGTVSGGRRTVSLKDGT